MILGRLFDWILILYGTSSDPLERNQHALDAAVPVHTNNASPVLGKKQILFFSFIYNHYSHWHNHYSTFRFRNENISIVIPQRVCK